MWLGKANALVQCMFVNFNKIYVQLPVIRIHMRDVQLHQESPWVIDDIDCIV